MPRHVIRVARRYDVTSEAQVVATFAAVVDAFGGV
jgi:NAD(P)-dependent dehydrogenase (short-subunit alcohol dehydrogenase family)